jgi:HD-GYP domain-containing protein (c-di-GMP phosphodiesterase class II)
MILAPTLGLGHLPIALATLQAESVIECDLFIESDAARGLMLLYRECGIPLDDSDLATLRDRDIDHIFIRIEDNEAYRDYLRANVLYNNDLGPAVRVAALRDLTRVQFRQAMHSVSCDALVELATFYGQDVVDVLSATPIEFHELMTLLDHDYYTFTHVCNVTMYCVLLATRLGMTNPDELAQFATGAMLHDIGKRTIPAAVLNKRSSLTHDEWVLIKRHPTDGYRQLVDHPEITWAQLMVVYQHHEHLDGSGYPVGAVKDDIHTWAQICTVADVFDAMTCARPYRRPIPVAEAREHFRRYTGKYYDPQVVEALLTGSHA